MKSVPLSPNDPVEGALRGCGLAKCFPSEEPCLVRANHQRPRGNNSLLLRHEQIRNWEEGEKKLNGFRRRRIRTGQFAKYFRQIHLRGGIDLGERGRAEKQKQAQKKRKKKN